MGMFSHVICKVFGPVSVTFASAIHSCEFLFVVCCVVWDCCSLYVFCYLDVAIIALPFKRNLVLEVKSVLHIGPRYFD